MEIQNILDEMKLFAFQTGGFGKWLAPDTDDEILKRLGRLDEEKLSKGQLNQLLACGHEAPVSDDFFTYYWLSAPNDHPYDVATVPFFETEWSASLAIRSLAHLKWDFTDCTGSRPGGNRVN